MKFILLTLAFLPAPIDIQLPVTETNFEETITNYEKWSTNIVNPEFYSEFQWTLDGKTVKLTDFSEFEKDQFYLTQIHKIAQELYDLNIAWHREMVTAEQFAATSFISNRQISVFLVRLQKLRITTAERTAPVVKEILEKHKDKISKKETEYILRRFKRWHKIQGLAM